MFTALHLLALAAALGAVASAAAQETAAGATQVYQQRTSDGRTVLSDRPISGARMQRTWQIAPEDRVAAQQRRDDARREAQAVTERIAGQLERERQRDETLALERLRFAQAEARRDVERSRVEALREPIVVFVPRAAPMPPRHPRPPRFPRPGPQQPRMLQPTQG